MGSIYFMCRDEDLEGDDLAFRAPRELIAYIKSAPPTSLRAEDVQDVQADMIKAMQKEMNEMEKNLKDNMKQKEQEMQELMSVREAENQQRLQDMEKEMQV